MYASSNKVGIITLSFDYRRKLKFSAIKRKKHVHISASAKLNLETSALEVSATNPILCIHSMNMFDLFDFKFCSSSPNTNKLCIYMGGGLHLKTNAILKGTNMHQTHNAQLIPVLTEHVDHSGCLLCLCWWACDFRCSVSKIKSFNSCLNNSQPTLQTPLCL